MPSRVRVGRSTTPFLPVVAIMIVGLIAFYPALRKLPLVQELLRETPKAELAKPTIKVWVNKRSGLYYCPQSTFYGKTQPGFYATQQAAMQSGDRPASQEACQQQSAAELQRSR